MYIEFRKGLERLGVTSYKFGYLIALARFKVRYLDLELKENLFNNYLEDQNVQMESKMPFDDNPDSLPHSDT